MSSATTCSGCGTPLPADAVDGALCPMCSQAAAAQTVMMKSPAGQGEKIGDYEVLGKLGHGGMGAVYKARQISLDRLVALKVLPSQFADDPEYIGRFQREAKVASGFHHDNLVSVYNYGTADGVHYIAMELIEGENLHQLLRHRRVDMAEALGITVYVAQGLKCGWDTARLVHRDIKPSNIYVSHDGHVKVGDLGLAKSLTSNTTGITQTGAMMGTPHYMSPEQGRGDKHIDFRADVYSLGCMLFEMLTGHPPYPGSDPVAVVHKHLHTPPPGLLKELPSCPMPVVLLVGRMLKKSPRDRHASYDELIAEIEALYHTLESGAPIDPTQLRRPGQRKTPPPAPVKEPFEWTSTIVGVLILVAVAAIFLPKPARKLGEIAVATPVVVKTTPRTSPIAAATPSATPAPTLAPTAPTFGPWQPLFTEAEWKQTAPGKREVVDGRVHLLTAYVMKPQPAADGAIRARVQFREGSKIAGLQARGSPDHTRYKLNIEQTFVSLYYFPGGATPGGIWLGKYLFPTPLQPGDTRLFELRVQGDRLTALVDGVVVIAARDSRIPGPGEWGILAEDGWFESVEVQTPLPTPTDGWEDLLAQLTPEFVAQNGKGWRLEAGELRSPEEGSSIVSLPGTLMGVSYQVRVKLRRLTRQNILNVRLPVGDRMTAFMIDGWNGAYTGLSSINGVSGKDHSGVVKGQQIKGSDPHDLEITVDLEGATARIAAKLDVQPLYQWTGPISHLSERKEWGTSTPGFLGLATGEASWAVSEVKVKRL